ncbi:M15 family metallopeptidase [Piscinibacter sakaiensis]|uniref:D-alanyl-D-alanine dipeptidase n=1 Tax=Piscinibacter sakaiensis TaxID=1547922 RepID=A0A0K8P798_PISS1|nr:M15 family metallopeptidase [Piscinibacter sakaiensis]GAP38496.1 D-alanyl-D-alanine dipeptidase [Piscinibacter sakaiensis]
MIDCESLPGHPDFRPLASLRGVLHELRYAGTDNFAGRVLYRGLDTAWLRREAAEGLEAAADWLARHRPGHRLLVLDALRPHRVQEAIWREVEGTPAAAYFADPAIGSVHSHGMAVDLTVLGPDGRERDMGAGFDEMSERSHPALETRHLALGVLGAEQLRERGWLYAAMAHGGFQGIATEWWHFDHGDRDQVRRMLPRVY